MRVPLGLFQEEWGKGDACGIGHVAMLPAQNRPCALSCRDLGRELWVLGARSDPKEESGVQRAYPSGLPGAHRHFSVLPSL